jgi:hypothetical protein
MLMSYIEIKNSRGRAMDDKRATMPNLKTFEGLTEHLIQRAMSEGQFDNLPGAGKPIELDETYDENWWIRQLIKREQLREYRKD